jgi:hypothetical protein
MVADTGDSFYQHAMDNITQMMNARFDERVKLVVHVDAPSPWETKCWEVTGATEVKGGEAAELKIGNAKPIVPSYGKWLLDFVQESVERYESEYYLLVLWGHGEGIDWKQKVLGGQPPSSMIKGVGKRFAPGSQGAIEVGELGKALAGLSVQKATKENVVVGFDACLMGMVEVYDEIEECVGWVVAANDEIPDTGWPYTNILNVLGGHPEKKPKELTEKIVDICAKWYSNNSPESKVSFAACDLSKSSVSPLVKAIEGLTKELRAHINKTPIREAVTEARDFAEDFEEIAYVDLYAFCSELKRQAERQEHVTELQQLSKAADVVIKTLSPFVIQHRVSDDYPYKYWGDARAVSICFPESAALTGSLQGIQIDWGSYIELKFSRDTEWPNFLAAFWDRRQVETDPFKPIALRQAAGGS